MERLTYWCDDGQGDGEWRVNVNRREESGPHVDRLAAYEELGSIDRLRELAGGPGVTSTITNGGKIRSMDDDRLAQEILHRWRAEMEAGKFEDISTRWCDMKGGCVSSKGYPRPCTEERLLACIKRWLQQPAEEGVNLWHPQSSD